MKDAKYEDIIHLPHPVSGKHPQMSLHNRAAQFSPFAALTGHEEKIKETARLTEQKVELDEYEMAVLDEKLQRIQSQIAQKPQITLVYFQADTKKAGGAYLTVSGRVKKIEQYARQIIFQDGTVIAMDDIYDIIYSA